MSKHFSTNDLPLSLRKYDGTPSGITHEPRKTHATAVVAMLAVSTAQIDYEYPFVVLTVC